MDRGIEMMEKCFLVITIICMVLLGMNLIVLMFDKNIDMKYNRRIYIINSMGLLTVSNFIVWVEMRFTNRRELIGENMVSLINLINVLICLILFLFLFIVKDTGHMKGRNQG